MGRTLGLILGDQLSLEISSLQHLDRNTDLVFMCEVWSEATYVKHHKKKIVFLFSAMRHFARKLVAEGWEVEYRVLDAEQSTSFSTAVHAAIRRHSISRVAVTKPGEHRVWSEMLQWQKTWGIPVDIFDDTRFLSTENEFNQWTKGRKQLRMEYFYRTMRKKHNILLERGKPIGGKWNYDAANRKPPPKGLDPPKPLWFEPDDITTAVIGLVEEKFDDHFGDVHPFGFAVNREQALQCLHHFVKTRLPFFGDYQDAMIQDQPWMYHSLISLYVNAGLLDPQEVVQAVILDYENGHVPLNAAEGFIRQVIGWREYIRGIYWHFMPDYKTKNALDAQRKLPSFYWTGQTKMNCLRQCVQDTKNNAYAHHIQRLMVLGNFALLAGVNPDEVNEWFLVVYADAYEWVELPNVTGMALYADGGIVASKPYASSGAYINKMSDYCKQCTFKVSKKLGNEACPFNYLYWDFLMRNADKLEDNQRLSMVYHTLGRMSEDQQTSIRENAATFLASLQ